MVWLTPVIKCKLQVCWDVETEVKETEPLEGRIKTFTLKLKMYFILKAGVSFSTIDALDLFYKCVFWKTL